MKIFTRVFLGVLALGLVFGSKASTLGGIPAGLPANTRLVNTSNSDTLFLNWRKPVGETVSVFGILPGLNFPLHNPNVSSLSTKKNSPFLFLTRNAGGTGTKPSVRNASASYASNSRTIAVNQGAKETKLIPSLNAYPNPSRGVTRISLSALGDDKYKIRISNVIGKVYKEIPLMQPSATETIVVDLSPLPAGVYFYSLLVNEKMVETKRLILQQQ
ncbi:T9SS type A sorting domain-containing protein [Rufibacter psychrotolerans]|uniref:T9SS type A sorting domain-containing protein n=1 Tax=Rufibacter psychrotolerans TaxID=2812556 RepID=UPI0019673277|nr:T9SS type A sorting domain-containing protein [Rufibacter sp. SYSU D00308]